MFFGFSDQCHQWSDFAFPIPRDVGDHGDHPISQPTPTPPPVPISKGLTPFLPMCPQVPLLQTQSLILNIPIWSPCQLRLRDSAEGRNPKTQTPGLKRPGGKKLRTLWTAGAL